MGWLFPYHTFSKQSLVSFIMHENPSVEYLAHSLRGNTLWTVERVKKQDGTFTDNAIGCYLISKSRETGTFGYKDLCESMHPYYYDCPLKFLKMAPISNNDWRVGVYAYHESKAQKKQAFKGLKVGCKVQLKPTCTIMGDRVTTPIEIIGLKPLTGTLNGMMVRIKKTHIASILP